MKQTSFPLSDIKVDLGDEAPLLAYDPSENEPFHARLNLRWLSATILASITSLTLMSGALYAALSGQPESIAPDSNTLLKSPDQFAEGSRLTKGDRLSEVTIPVKSRRTMQVSTVSRVGEQDFVNVRPFVHIEASLKQFGRVDSAVVPPFDPVRIFSEGSNTANEFTASTYDSSIYGADVDGEVLISHVEFPYDSTPSFADIEPDGQTVANLVTQQVPFLNDGNTHFAALPIVDPGRFDFEQASLPQAAHLGVQITAENVSFVQKSQADKEHATTEEKIVSPPRTRSVFDLLVENGTETFDAANIMSAFGVSTGLTELSPDHKMRLGYGTDPVTGDTILSRVSLYADAQHQVTLARVDTGLFVRAPEPEQPNDLFRQDGPVIRGPKMSLYDSLYQTALDQNVPQDMISRLVRILSFDVDFRRTVKAGDKLELFYSDHQTNAFGETTDPELLYVGITLAGQERRYYRFRTPDDSVVDYYDSTGKSAKKFLMRKPMQKGRFRSAFGMRRHPILGIRKMHSGVDWSAPRGTPILAAGNGTITHAGWKRGYGKFTTIQHANGYETAYAHQTAFAKGIRPGTRVRQGQVIGYVGSTGLSTGPHLHYEVRVNGRRVNPMRIRLPRGRVLDGTMLTDFEQQQKSIDELLYEDSSGKRTLAAN
ncbi:M23 family metallopeptidase [Coralliovum pocilloporae]|uniref:M23 family metallopeptidase n=1 Tax=Coralliovum pocilloporae TaxID=3066369 RepID=UPI00330790FF